MMNSVADDEFPPNPFRSSDMGVMNTAPSPAAPPPQQNFAPPPAQGMNNFGMPPPQDQFAPQPPQQQFHEPAQPYAMPQGRMDGGMMSSDPSLDMSSNGSPGRSNTLMGACMQCLRIDTWTAYFDIDTIDIQNRIVAALIMFHLPDHFRNVVVGAQRDGQLKGPDLYGPFWITITLVFIIGVSANYSAYLDSSNTVVADDEVDIEEFEYDITHLASAFTLVGIFVFGVPAAFWLITRCMSMPALNLVDWVCYYGYSMVPYLPACTLCIFPNWMWDLLVLMAATAASCLLVLRNVANPLLAADPAHQKAPPLVLAILGAHVIFMFVLYWTHYRHISS